MRHDMRPRARKKHNMLTAPFINVQFDFGMRSPNVAG
jgi:hypothetical protein